ncbi:predicted protein [Chaetoceros tenuissimus]|uniref:Uncharacterized protein n=1 Tax=Chaetoceros tenuissimus TaxID=426638 RepID=A0AAD3GZ62_9STRA|nr:predicted protein [Chaetoceros tenuissimus]
MRKSRVFILVFTISILVLAALCVGLVFAFLPKKAKEEAPSYAPSISSSPSQSPTISSAPTRTKTYTLLKTFELVGERNGDAFGDSISMSADGSILAVGASSGELDNSGQLNIGWVKVYKRNEDNEMLPYGLPIYGAQNPGALFGYNLSLSPDGSTLE